MDQFQEKGTEDRSCMMATTMSQMRILLCLTLFFLVALRVATGIVPETSQDIRELSTFGRHFWSTADKQHYRISKDSEVAEIVLDQLAGNY